MRVLYTCHACRVINRDVTVRARGSDEELGHWLDAAVLACGEDHRRFSPYCRAGNIDLKIPIPGNGSHEKWRVGEERKQ